MTINITTSHKESRPVVTCLLVEIPNTSCIEVFGTSCQKKNLNQIKPLNQPLSL